MAIMEITLMKLRFLVERKYRRAMKKGKFNESVAG